MQIGESSIDSFLDALASKEPTPGGGAVAGLLAGIASSLGNMVLAYSEGKKSLAEHCDVHADCFSILQEAQSEAIRLGNADAQAYEKVSELWKLPKDNATRIESWDAVHLDAARVPIEIMKLSENVLQTLQRLHGKTNAMLRSDLLIAALVAETAARSAFFNVGVNTGQVADAVQKEKLDAQASKILATCRVLALTIETTC
jgi:formiminotetrahydrofolate cyclodeaminase